MTTKLILFSQGRKKINPKKENKQARHWACTINEGVKPEIKQAFLEFIKQQKFWSFQDEIGEAGNAHIQAYFGSNEKLYGSSLLSRFPGVHVEVARSPANAFDYCLKEESRAPGGRSERSELRPSASGNNGGGGDQWRLLRERVERGADIIELEFEFPGIVLRHRNAIMDCIARRDKRLDLQRQIDELESGSIRTQSAECHILWGPPGGGKTRMNRIKALKKCKELNLRLYEVQDDQWFQDYCGEEIILIQDVTPNRYKQSWLLRLMDGHNVWFPCKGGGAYGDIKFVFMDSNYDPETWFTQIGKKPTEDEIERAHAIMRRAGEGQNVIYVPNPLLDEQKKKERQSLYEKLKGTGLRRPKVSTASPHSVGSAFSH